MIRLDFDCCFVSTDLSGDFLMIRLILCLSFPNSKLIHQSIDDVDLFSLID